MTPTFNVGDRVRFSREIFPGPDKFSHLVGTVTASNGHDLRVRWDGPEHKTDAQYRPIFLEAAPIQLNAGGHS